MAYTPVGWQTGDTITAERLNRMDRGWGYENVELFSETVTTAGQDGVYEAELAYAQLIDADPITVTYDGMEYVCPRISDTFGRTYGAHWSDELGGYDFSEYPFGLVSVSSNPVIFATQTAGEHTVAVSASTLQTSADFSAAVHPIADEAIASAIASVPTPLLVTINTTTWAEVNSALKAGRPALVWNHTIINKQPDTYEFVAEAKYTSWKVYTLAVVGGAVVVNTYQASSQTSALELVTS